MQICMKAKHMNRAVLVNGPNTLINNNEASDALGSDNTVAGNLYLITI